jgi:serine protease
MKKIKTLSKWLAVALMISMLPLQTFALSIDRSEIKTDQQKPLSVEIQTAGKKFRGDRVVVKYKNDSKHFRTVTLAAGETVESALSKYKGDKTVVSVEPDYIAYATAVPNDPLFSYQWNMDNTTGSGINVKNAWDISTGSGVVVAVVDTGVAYETSTSTGKTYTKAPDLANTCFVAGYDFINNDTHPNDDNSHGTHVAGTIAQSTNNGVGVAGIAYNSCIMPVKVLDANGSGSYSAVANGIYYATDNGAKIINMSLGGSADSSIMRDAVAYAYTHGVTVIAAAGNDNSSAPNYPSSYNDYVISVGATDYAKARAPYSNYGPDVDVVAPGGDTSADLNGDGYGDGILQNTFSSTNVNAFSYYFFQGTSMATPHVAGVAALLIAHGNATSPDDVREALQSTAQDIGAIGKDTQFGYGLIDAFATLQWTGTTTPLVNQAPIANAGIDQTILVNDSVWFNGIGSSDDAGIVSYNWNFGDGMTAVGATTSHIYTTAGIYTATLTVSDVEGLTGTDTTVVTVNESTPVNLAPIANAGIDQTIIVNNSVLFNGLQSSDDKEIVSYDWNFGDNTNGTGATTSHVYTTVGTFTATLTVTDAEGLTGTDAMIITVNPIPNTAPIANAGVDKTALVKASVSFSGSASTDDKGIVSYGWNFGDGSTATGMTASHTFNTSGTFTVTLTVTDAEGLTGTDTATVTVRAANVVVSTMSTVDTRINRNYTISVSAKNNETTSQAVTYHIDVKNPNGVLMTWAGLADKTATISKGGTTSKQWSNKVPTNSVKGTYTVNAKLMVNGVVTGTSSKTFTVR